MSYSHFLMKIASWPKYAGVYIPASCPSDHSWKSSLFSTARDHQKMHERQLDKNQVLREQTWWVEIHRLQEELRIEQQEKERLEKERKRMQQETNSIEELQQRERSQ